MRVLVTGASGFVGTALVGRLSADSRWQVRASSRVQPAVTTSGVEWVSGPDLSAETDWRGLLTSVDVVVHLAARVHDMTASDDRSAREFQRTNALGTARLGAQAAERGVRRLVFLSSIKVNGESGVINDDSAEAPADAYARSKTEAERALREIGRTTPLEVVTIRSPLVYGPGAKANFQSLLSAVRRGIPLPFGAITNRRSFVGVDNLVDLIVVCLDHPSAASETFLVGDGEDLSTAQLVRRLAAAAGCPARLVPIPAWGLRLAGMMLGKSAAVQRLTGSLQVDIAKARRLLGWAPPVSVDEGLRRAVRR